MIIFNEKKPTSAAFSLIYGPFLDVFKIVAKNHKMPDVFFKIFRTAIVADLLYKEGHKKVFKDDEAKKQFLSFLFESFILYVRIVYDLSTDIMQEYSVNIIKKSYNDLISDIKKGKIKGLDQNLCKYIVRYSDKFVDLKNIRDSIKRNSTADIYIKNKTFFVFLKYFGKKERVYKILDERLSVVVFSECAFLCVLAVRLRQMIEKNNLNI
jgi:hypothetical protein